jgi:hypothetical protein
MKSLRAEGTSGATAGARALQAAEDRAVGKFEGGFPQELKPAIILFERCTG